MKNKIYSLIIVALFACNINSPNKIWEEANKMQESKKIKDSIILHKKIITNYPEHKYAVQSQFTIAEIYLNDVKEYEIAIEEFNNVITNYPQSSYAMNSLFMIAYIYNNYLNAYSNAIEAYNLFLSKYPNEELIPSVRYELNGLKKYEQQIDSLNNILKQNNI